MSDHLPAISHPLRGLVVAGPRLGWRYQDPALAMTPFPEAQPVAPPAPAPPAAGQKTGTLTRRLLITGGLGTALTLIFACCGLVAAGPSGTAEFGNQIKLAAVLMALGTIGVVVLIVVRHQLRAGAAVQEAQRPFRDYQVALAMWQQRAAQHHAAEAARVAHLPVWQSIGPRPGTPRLDVVGGTQFGWRDLLTVAGTGYLATHGPSTIVDLTGDQICADLRELCAAVEVSVDWQTLPGDCDLLTGLDSGQLVDVLVESVHGDGDRDARGQRATDSRILSAIVEALGDQVTLARIVDALRVLLRLPGTTPALSAAERAHISDELFPQDYLSAAAVALQRLEAHLHPLRGLTGSTVRPAATLTVMGAVSDGTSARSELLDDLIVAWVTRRVATRPDLCRTLVIAGADPLAGRHVERLADICARQGVTLILLWRHLRDTAHQALGGGAVAFMRLRNGDEASRAADFIGRTHRFVLSGLTRTVGGSTTSTEGTGSAHAVTTGHSQGMSRSGRIGRLIDAAQTWTRNSGSSTGTTTTTSTQSSLAASDTWSDSTATSRVYEYAVEPTVLQGLPEQALLLVEHGPGGPAVVALDCNPAIVTLPAVNMASTASRMIPQQRPPAAVAYTPPPQTPGVPLQAGGAVQPQQVRAELWSDPDR